MSDRDFVSEGVGAATEMAAIWLGMETAAPGAGFAATAITKLLTGRGKKGKEILRSELKRAGATARDFRDAEQLAQAAWRYARAVRDQAAVENLRILAQAMIGCARRAELWASDFLKYADILAPLSHDELNLIGIMMAEDKAFYSTPRPPNSEGAFWLWVIETAVKAPPLAGTFESIEYLNAVAARAVRSGLILPIAGFDGTSYALSPIGKKVREFVNIESALRSIDSQTESDHAG